MNLKFLSKINKQKNRFIMLIISFYDDYQKYIRIILPVAVLFLAIWLTNIILKPIQFEKERDYRYTLIKEKLIDIRSAQLAYKERNGQFTNSFEELVQFVKLDSFILIQKTDSLVMYDNEIYKEKMLKDSTFIDTLGKVSILDSLFSTNYPIDSLSYVPPLNQLQFELKAGVINKSKIDVPVFQAKDPNPYDSRKPLIIGSMIEANLNGNWQ
tara:strand:+ start:1159 stop:1794 length:636 start_codon:yes stop_codon:yes gene_type:complete